MPAKVVKTKKTTSQEKDDIQKIIQKLKNSQDNRQKSKFKEAKEQHYYLHIKRPGSDGNVSLPKLYISGMLKNLKKGYKYHCFTRLAGETDLIDKILPSIRSPGGDRLDDEQYKDFYSTDNIEEPSVRARFEQELKEYDDYRIEMKNNEPDTKKTEVRLVDIPELIKYLKENKPVKPKKDKQNRETKAQSLFTKLKSLSKQQQDGVNRVLNITNLDGPKLINAKTIPYPSNAKVVFRLPDEENFMKYPIVSIGKFDAWKSLMNSKVFNDITPIRDYVASQPKPYKPVVDTQPIELPAE